MALSNDQFMELRSKPISGVLHEHTNQLSFVNEMSSKSYKQVPEIKIRLHCFTRSQYCSQMLWGLNSYLKSKDILLMTAELRPLGIQGN